MLLFILLLMCLILAAILYALYPVAVKAVGWWVALVGVIVVTVLLLLDWYGALTAHVTGK